MFRKRRKYGRRRRKRSYTKRKRFGGKKRTSRTFRPKGPNPIADRSIVRLKYVETVGMNVGSLAVPVYFDFRLNSIYDPNVSGTGHQPYGHDTYQALYGQYKVWRCKWRVTFQCRAGLQVTCAVRPEILPSTPAATGDAFMEQPRCISKMTNADTQPVTFTGACSLPHLFGVSKTEYASGTLQYEASFGTNPTSTAFLRLMTYSGTNTTSVEVKVMLIYSAELTKPFTLGQS